MMMVGWPYSSDSKFNTVELVGFDEYVIVDVEFVLLDGLLRE